jgi:N6-adenosine-specific RNA methylase IME4
VLDGHNRRDICEKLGIEAKIKQIALGNREEALFWIANKQLGRRNLTTFSRIELAYRLEPIIREQAKLRQKDAHKLRGKEADKEQEAIHTDDECAKIAGTSPKSYQKGKAIIKNASEDQKQKLRKNELSLDAVYKEISPQKKNADGKATPRPAVNTKSGEVTQPSSEPTPAISAAKPLPHALVEDGETFDVIFLNVPWGRDGIDEETIFSLQIREMAEENCMLLLRAKNSTMAVAYDALFNWDFSGVSVLTWIKQKPEPGEWIEDQTEHFIVAVKGKPEIRREHPISTALNATAKSGTNMPVGFYQLIEGYCVGEKKLVIFPDSAPDSWHKLDPLEGSENAKSDETEAEAEEKSHVKPMSSFVNRRSHIGRTSSIDASV